MEEDFQMEGDSQVEEDSPAVAPSTVVSYRDHLDRASEEVVLAPTSEESDQRTVV